jgi:ribose transport system substrate-binding protein
VVGHGVPVIAVGGITKHFGSIQARPGRPRGRGWRPRVTSTAAALGLLSGALFGVGAPAARAAARYTIELIPGLTVEPFYITMHYGAEQEAAKLGVTLEWAGATTFSPTTQIPVVNSVLANKPSALLIAPTDAYALFPPMDAYVEAGIPVITVDTTLANTSILTSAISSDNYQGGEEAADTIASLAHDKGQVAVINVMPNVSTTDLRQAGFLAEMKNKYPNMKVVAHVYDQDSPTTAESEARSIIQAHPGLVGIFGTNLYSAQGAGKGVDAAGRKGKVLVAGYDAEPLEVKLLKQGVINILVIQNPAEEGSLAVQYAYDYLTGDKSAIKKSVLLRNVVATTANANNPSISKYYYKTSA